MPAYLNPAIKLALLVAAALVLSVVAGGRAGAHESGHGRGGYGYDDRGTYDAGHRHEADKERHYDRVRRFDESHGGHGDDSCDCGDDRYGESYRHRHRGHRRHGYGRRNYDDGFVCDPDGDRCYRSDGGYWDYREYYRRHGYRWLDERR
jgi:hypothetical protein